jgi:hypothetical protein
MVDVMALLEGSAPNDGQKCRTCIWLESRPQKERDTWVRALEDTGSWEGTTIVRAMAKVESDLRSPSISSIRNHRGGHARNLDQGGNRVS